MSYRPSARPISRAVRVGGQGLRPPGPPVLPSLLAAGPSRVLLALSPKQPWEFHQPLCCYYHAGTRHRSLLFEPTQMRPS